MKPNRPKETMREAVLSVTHDLRSPLLTVKEIISRYSHIMSQKDLEAAVAATTRATDICNETLSEIGIKEKESSHTNHPYEAIDRLVKEMNIRNEAKNISTKFNCLVSSDVQISLEETALTRMVSNLLENSVRAIGSNGNIKVVMTNYSESLFVTVHDDGHGISASQLEKLGNYGVSFSKGGHGFALWSIKKTLKEMGGGLIVDSQEGFGTKITLEIPLSESKERALNLSEYNNFVLIDDDILIHELIDFCLDSIGFEGHRHYLKNKEEFEGHMNQLDSQSIKETCFVVDGHLGRNNPVGLRLIRGYDIAKQSVLFTGDEEMKSLGNQKVMVRCKTDSPFDFLKLQA